MDDVYVHCGGDKILKMPEEKACVWLIIKCWICGKPATILSVMGSGDYCDKHANTKTGG